MVVGKVANGCHYTKHKLKKNILKMTICNIKLSLINIKILKKSTVNKILSKLGFVVH